MNRTTVDRKTLDKYFEQRIGDFIIQFSKDKDLLSGFYAYLQSRSIGSGRSFRVTFKRTVNYHFMESLNHHLINNKIPENYIFNKNAINNILGNVYAQLEKMHLTSDSSVYQYKSCQDDELHELMHRLIHVMSDSFYNIILKRRDEPGIPEHFDQLFFPLDQPRSPYVPQIELTVRDPDGHPRDLVTYPTFSRQTSITHYKDTRNTEGEDDRQIYRTTPFMQHGGQGSSHHFNPTNSQATQALGYWEKNGQGHFVGATQSFKKHAEQQLIELFEIELDKHPQLKPGGANRETGDRSVTLHLFISKSPCTQNCIPMLEDFLTKRPNVHVEFYFQQWYETNEEQKAINNAKEFLERIKNKFTTRINYHYLPLATSAHSLYLQHQANPAESPFKPMPSTMINTIYAAYDRRPINPFRDDPLLAEKRELMWNKVQSNALSYLISPLDDFHTLPGAIAAVASEVDAAQAAASSDSAWATRGFQHPLQDDFSDLDTAASAAAAAPLTPQPSQFDGQLQRLPYATAQYTTQSNFAELPLQLEPIAELPLQLEPINDPHQRLQQAVFQSAPQHDFADQSAVAPLTPQLGQFDDQLQRLPYATAQYTTQSNFAELPLQLEPINDPHQRLQQAVFQSAPQHDFTDQSAVAPLPSQLDPLEQRQRQQTDHRTSQAASHAGFWQPLREGSGTVASNPSGRVERTISEVDNAQDSDVSTWLAPPTFRG